ncbi:MAG: DNA/RNA non-specific endonuclease [Bacteroidaceae bacterium]|nr:DNA/RNA non-specific endonuclease [Bacteroidaceae bacterium]
MGNKRKTKKKGVSFVTLLLAVILVGCGLFRNYLFPTPKGLEIPYFEADKTNQVIEHMGYTVSYNQSMLIPNWVAYVLDIYGVRGDVKRTDNFCPDPDIIGPQAELSDYRNSGYDRGHMAPAGDMKWSSQAMEESFYLSNMCPQLHNLNNGDWKELEELLRTLTDTYPKLYIVSGPIVEKKNPKTIGANRVVVPDKFFKAVVAQRSLLDNALGGAEEYTAIGFVFPHVAGHKPLKAYACTIDSLEKVIGMDLFHNLDDKIEKAIEKQYSLSDWNIN